MKTERKALKKKLRFDVFKRDGFKCQYCGATPPSVILHVDHINPVAKGGKNEIDNLVTSCDTCNIGKGATLLSSVPKSLAEKAKETAEREEQIKMYNQILQDKAERIENEAWSVVFAIEGEKVESYDRQNLSSIKRFLGLLPFPIVLEAAERSCWKFNRRDLCFRYFCGICWNKIKEQTQQHENN